MDADRWRMKRKTRGRTCSRPKKKKAVKGCRDIHVERRAAELVLRLTPFLASVMKLRLITLVMICTTHQGYSSPSALGFVVRPAYDHLQRLPPARAMEVTNIIMQS